MQVISLPVLVTKGYQVNKVATWQSFNPTRNNSQNIFALHYPF